jgi:hypothetical protein
MLAVVKDFLVAPVVEMLAPEVSARRREERLRRAHLTGQLHPDGASGCLYCPSRQAF